MPLLNCYVSEDDLRFLHEEAKRRNTDPASLAEAAIENAILEARRDQPAPVKHTHT